ncbi:uncharacterized protein LOC129951412 isoform X2 [Eupeodes corollae]|uniref:uncharacterized protein LOC129951412 isoform X2 n=1 Tax=Eupeodes corollae TaxID=290404 RepID=UPI0024938154|nr:uncharacterized protein LOC129951412 isoform X2 [Eupeodes corollae]
MDIHLVRLMIACWSLLTLCVCVAVHCSPVYPNVNLLMSQPNFEPMCSSQQERFIESDGKESSLILEFNPETKKESCLRILSAPAAHGFIVRLIIPKLKKKHHNAHAGPPLMDVDRVQRNRTCPLKIFSSLEPQLLSWQVDPCQLEDATADMEDPVKLFQGRLRVVWEHGGHELSSKLMITVLGKGDACQEENKHPCLKIGLEPLLCISKALVCDGIRHCPYSIDYDSDEDNDMCWNRKKIDDGVILEHWVIEMFRNLFAFDAPPPNAEANTTKNPITEKTVNDGAKNKSHVVGENMASGSGYTRRNTTRLGLNSDLSKYGPWGYLMLGMLLCGGALLICGLWASASQSAHSDSDASMQQGNITIEHQSTPPNYEELDPPPPYSVLFPNQKAVTPEADATAVTSASVMQTSTSTEPNTSSTPTSTPTPTAVTTPTTTPTPSTTTTSITTEISVTS